MLEVVKDSFSFLSAPVRFLPRPVAATVCLFIILLILDFIPLSFHAFRRWLGRD